MLLMSIQISVEALQIKKESINLLTELKIAGNTFSGTMQRKKSQ
jgi:hypothetical protein